MSVGSRSVEKAQEFIDRVAGGNKSIKAFGTYEEVYADKVNERDYRIVFFVLIFVS